MESLLEKREPVSGDPQEESPKVIAPGKSSAQLLLNRPLPPSDRMRCENSRTTFA